MSFKVNPFGEIANSADRNATLLGNRGVLLVENKELVGLSRWKTQSWIYCSMDKKFKPEGEDTRKYIKLFFYDEFTALAAGHRPCCDCQPDRFEAFVAAWLAGNPEYGYGKYDIKKIDKKLHDERKNSDRSKKTYKEKLANLPDGVMVTLDVASGESFLLQNRQLRIWSSAGYNEPFLYDLNSQVQVLTPRSIVHAINKGFKPEVVSQQE